jgi:hypothetical protein
MRDASNNGYVCERVGRIRKITAGTNAISTFATLATTKINSCTMDNNGAIYAGDIVNNFIWRVSSAGAITRWAGNGWRGNTGDGGNALNAMIFPWKLSYSAKRNVIVMADPGNGNIREIAISGTSAGTITRIVGTNVPTPSGNGVAYSKLTARQPALGQQLNSGWYWMINASEWNSPAMEIGLDVAKSSDTIAVGAWGWFSTFAPGGNVEHSYSATGILNTVAMAHDHDEKGMFVVIVDSGGGAGQRLSWVRTSIPAGQFSASGWAPGTPCPPGTFTDGQWNGPYWPGPRACTPCPVGRIAASTGSTSCTACPAGSTSTVGSSTCTQCPAGALLLLSLTLACVLALIFTFCFSFFHLQARTSGIPFASPAAATRTRQLVLPALARASSALTARMPLIRHPMFAATAVLVGMGGAVPAMRAQLVPSLPR